MGSKKSALWSPRVAKTLPKWRPTWASKNLVFEAQVGTHLGRVLAVHAWLKIDFLKPIHVGLMLAVNMNPCWTANMDLCWRPTWTYVGGQHGPMLEANMDPCSVCPGSNSVCPGSNSVCPGAVLCARGAVLCARGAILCAWEQFCVPRQQKINIFYPRTIKNQYFLSPDHDKSYFLFRDH